MADLMRIADARDEALAPFRDVRERDLRGRHGLFVGEGPLTVERMLDHPGVTRALLVDERRAEDYRDAVDGGVDVLVAPESVIGEVVGFPFHRGVLAVGLRGPFDDRGIDDVVPPASTGATLLLVDGVTNVDNIGLLFRNAAAFGCDGVVLSASCHDPLYRKALRVSLGHVLTTPWCRAADWSAALEDVQGRGCRVVVAALASGAVPLDDLDPPARVALVVGQEREGVSSESLSSADHVVKIPMAPGVDSLNVAAASAVCLHHLSRGPRE